MRRWIKSIGIFAVAVGLVGGGLYYMDYPYKSSLYMAKVMEKNNQITNYERKTSISLSVNSGAGDLASFKKIDGSFLVINEKRDVDKRLVSYDLTSQGESFEGESYEGANHIVFKSPMYHRYILFDEEPEMQSKKDSRMKAVFASTVMSNLSEMDVDSNTGANDDGIKTLSVPLSSGQISDVMTATINSMGSYTPYENILYQNEKITNKLLHQNKSEEDVKIQFGQDKERIVDAFSQVMSRSNVKSSELTLKVDKDKIVNEMSIILEFEYDESGIRVPFKLFIDVSTWNVNKTKVKEPMTDPTNSLPYDRMTDDINYFENENLATEEQPEEDESHIMNELSESPVQRVSESTMTLEELGEDFTPLLPDDRKAIKQDKE